MKPEWFRCETCLFGINTGSVPTIECKVTNIPMTKFHTDFCKEWVCKTCWESWDTCDYPDKNLFIGIYADHTKCVPVKFKGE